MKRGGNVLEKDMELILLAKRGDREALTKLLVNRQAKLYKTALLYIHNKDDALDIVQETSLQAFLSIKHLHHLQYFDTWLIRILINVSRHLYRRETPVPEIVELTADCHKQVDLHQDLMQDLVMVPEKFRVVLILFYFNELQDANCKNKLATPQAKLRGMSEYLLKIGIND
ncbi:RNA polymerase [Pediococcus ethanolidurans]|nr:RNA polymerase [Pediococcus ethanolidurans]